MPRLAIFWVLIVAATAAFVAGCALNASIWLQGSVGGRAAPGLRAALAAGWRGLRRVGPGRLLRALLRDGLWHRRLRATDRGRWLAHALLLGGFLAMFALSTLTGLCQEVLILLFKVRHPLVEAIVNKDTPVMALANEALGVAMLAGLALMIVRRYVRRPAQLRTAAPDTALIVLLAVTLLSGYPTEVLRILAERVPASLAWYSFVAYPLSLPAQGLDWPWPALHDWAFLFHSSFAAAFLAYAPFSKFFHVLVSPIVAAANSAAREVELA
ncbi:MAG TPA: respiratory nitrate reductase subunit gamma [Anaerolineae bacterium]|nr:respiratory nitrate reductase subunit gamma [Anaerolineae bacterium]HOQ97471.1 respiratory nitrate reductase subunit gamma [Anaerolineae bacterium]HPL27322.1 respiratory nitrate reductase subunit gamma [Anaerolineae bacterium]HPL27325.1 respiratory nitrate reductase subunit gamma [Anaerolineae bacterium]